MTAQQNVKYDTKKYDRLWHKSYYFFDDDKSYSGCFWISCFPSLRCTRVWKDNRQTLVYNRIKRCWRHIFCSQYFPSLISSHFLKERLLDRYFFCTLNIIFFAQKIVIIIPFENLLSRCFDLLVCVGVREWLCKFWRKCVTVNDNAMLFSFCWRRKEDR